MEEEERGSVLGVKEEGLGEQERETLSGNVRRKPGEAETRAATNMVVILVKFKIAKKPSQGQGRTDHEGAARMRLGSVLLTRTKVRLLQFLNLVRQAWGKKS